MTVYQRSQLLHILSISYCSLGIRQDSEGRPEEEDNFQEAIKNALKALVPTKAR